MAVRLWGLLAALEQRCAVPLSSRSAASTSSAGISRFSTQFVNRRRSFSTTAGARVSPEAEDDLLAQKAEDAATRNKLEQALIELRIYSAAPDWLPLFPGGSYWIHPEQIEPIARQAEILAGPMIDPASEREVLAMVTPMGWPVESLTEDAMKPETDFSQ